MPDDLRGWLHDALARRARHPHPRAGALPPLQALEQGPLEQIAELVHAVVEELRLAQRRLDEQAADLRALQLTVARLSDRVDDVEAEAPAPGLVPLGHLVLLPTAAGYELLQRDAPPPAPGDPVEHDGRLYRVLRRGRSPLPADERPCVLALPA